MNIVLVLLLILCRPVSKDSRCRGEEVPDEQRSGHRDAEQHGYIVHTLYSPISMVATTYVHMYIKLCIPITCTR